MDSATIFAGEEFGTIMMHGCTLTKVMGAKSAIGSYPASDREKDSRRA
jgi:hypothetical protein